jgi:Ca-activated chloride channel family protein
MYFFTLAVLLFGSTQTVIVTGRVTDAANRAVIAGAQVTVPGTRMGDLTDGAGVYRLTKTRNYVGAPATADPDWNTESYNRINENGFRSAKAEPLSTFSIDVDRASYSNIRRFIRQGQLPPKDAVRIEEMINYFPYAYRAPKADEPFSITTEMAAAPWQREHRLVRIGLQAARVDMKNLPPNNLVFLIDVSGSMQPPNKLPLLKQSLRLLVQELRPVDRIAMVVYAGNAGLVLPSTPGSEKEVILDALESLEAGGSTAGGAGLRLAYKVAQENHLCSASAWAI